jgi:hypothetical protein
VGLFDLVLQRLHLHVVIGATLNASAIAHQHGHARIDDPRDEGVEGAALGIEVLCLTEQMQHQVLFDVLLVGPAETGTPGQLFGLHPNQRPRVLSDDVIAINRRVHSYLLPEAANPGLHEQREESCAAGKLMLQKTTQSRAMTAGLCPLGGGAASQLVWRCHKACGTWGSGDFSGDFAGITGRGTRARPHRSL